VIAAVEPKQMIMVESDDPRFQQQDPRMRAKEFAIPEDELLDLTNS